jgi:glucose-1-phosphate cytidylyltransferase
VRVIILAGGKGTRISEDSVHRPKPMIELGGKPILWHIMSIYAAAGFDDFVVACGYKSEMIKEYFHNFFIHNSDYIVHLRDGAREVLTPTGIDWHVAVVDTGLETMTGGRLRRLRPWLGDETFLATYGDGLADIDIRRLVAFHRAHGRLATVTAVRPPSRFGALVLNGDEVAEFSEKQQTGEGWINGGFFVFERGVFDYLEGDPTILEREPMERLARDRQLMAYRHEGFWQPMDTLRDKQQLEEIWASGRAPWKLWA